MNLHKSPDVIVLRASDGGLKLLHRVTRRVMNLTSAESNCWIAPRAAGDLPLGAAVVFDRLLSGGFLIESEGSAPIPLSIGCDTFIPQVASSHVRWYQESPDLFILFSTRPMSSNNPLLALGPYGSLCWRMIEDSWTVGEIRCEALRIFGADEVAPYLRRLVSLGLVEDIPGLSECGEFEDRLAKEFPAPEVQSQIGHAVIPWYCLWELCSTCDLQCRTCYLSRFDGSGPDTSVTESIIAQIADARIFYVAIMGGEPLLRDDLSSIVERLRSAQIFVKVITNGCRLSGPAARTLARAGLNQLEISLDGLSRATHECSRGAGTFEQALRAIERAQDAGIPRFALVLTLRRDNLAEFGMLPEFMDAHGIRECYISQYKKVGARAMSATFSPLDDGDVQSAARRIERWRAERPDLIIALGGYPSCSCGRTSVVIGENGDVRMCPFLPKGVASLRSRPLRDIWDSLGPQVGYEEAVGYCGSTIPRW